MAARKQTKARSGPKPSAAKAPPPLAAKSGRARSKAQPAADFEALVQRLEATTARLEAELETARAKIAALESARIDAINRIDWVIDSLESLAHK